MFLVVLVILIISIFILKWRLRNSYGDLLKLPGPKTLPLVGNAFNVRPSPYNMLELISGYQEQYGDLFVMWFGPIPLVNVISPTGAEAILSSRSNISKGRSYSLIRPWLGQGLLTSDGRRWASHRKMITPTFHFAILETFLDVFQENANMLVKNLSSFSEVPVNIVPYVTLCMLDIICETAMGVKMNAQKQMANEKSDTDAITSEYMKSMFGLTHTIFERILSMVIRIDQVFFRTKKGKEYLKYLASVHEFTRSVIAARRGSGPEKKAGERMAFLDLLLEVRDQDGKPLSDEDIREEVDTIMFAGHDTTSTSIVWTLYLLGKHPEIQEEIYQELKEIFNQDEERAVTLSDLTQMKKMERAIKESLRLYPSVPSVTRTISEDFTIDGYRVPKGSSLVVHIYQLHRDPLIYPDPEKFDPDRFLPENSSTRHPFSYLPFSAGPRNCMGQKFAFLEEKMILCQVLRSYQVYFLGEMDSKKVRCELILRPAEDQNFLFKKRVS